MSSILLPRALSAAPSVAQINWDAPVLDGAVCVVSENVLYTRKNKIITTATKTDIRYAGRSFFTGTLNCYIPELDTPTISMLAVSALDTYLIQYGTYVGFGYYVSQTDRQGAYTSTWATNSSQYKGMFRQGSFGSPNGSMVLSMPWRGVYGFRSQPSLFQNIVVNESGSIYIDNGGYYGSHSVDSRKAIYYTANLTLVVAYNTFITESQIKEFSSAPYKIFKGSPRFIEHQSASGYTHPALSAATLVPAGGNTYQPRVTYTFA